MASQSSSTTDHDVIRKWTEERDGKPSVVIRGNDKTELLRIDFPGYSGDDLQEIEWEEWFRIFDENNLALIYQEETKDGERSNFNKLVDRSKAEQHS